MLSISPVFRPRAYTVRRPQYGFSLIEMMISVVIGLVVVGAAVAFTVAGVQANAEILISSRLAQEVRAAHTLVSRELRRAGYNGRGLDGIGQGPVFISPFASMFVRGGDDACVVYAYDRDGGVAGVLEPANNEIRALRRTLVDDVGVLQFAQGAGISCDADANWENLTDPRIFDVRVFDIEQNPTLATVPAGIEAVPRTLRINLEGSLVSQPDVVRSMQTRIRVRAECIREDVAACFEVPTP